MYQAWQDERTYMNLVPLPRKIIKTGDDTPAKSLLRYVWRMSSWHQVLVCLLAVVVALLNLAPIELQRRIINEVVESRDLGALIWFGGIYVALILSHQVMKYCLWMYQSWLTESASLRTRRHLLKHYENEERNDEKEDSGQAVSVIGSEVEKLGGFVGEALSGAASNGSMLLGVVGYMFFVEPQIAIFALAFLIPQVVLTPFLQRRLNDLLETRLQLLRDLGDEISGEASVDFTQKSSTVGQIYTNRMRFFFLKFAMKSALNLLNSLGPITVLLFGGYLVMQGEVQIGVIVAFISGFERISSPLRELIGFYRVTAQANVQHRMVADWMR